MIIPLRGDIICQSHNLKSVFKVFDHVELTNDKSFNITLVRLGDIEKRQLPFGCAIKNLIRQSDRKNWLILRKREWINMETGEVQPTLLEVDA